MSRNLAAAVDKWRARYYSVDVTIDGLRGRLTVRAASAFRARQAVLWYGALVIVHSIEARRA